MSDSDSLLSRFIGGTISVGLGTLSVMVLGLLGMMVAARYLTAEALGAFVLLRVVAFFFTQVSSFGLDLSMAKFITSTEDDRHKRKLINTVIYFRLFTICVVSLVALIVMPALSTLFGSSLSSDLAVFVPLLFLLQSSRRLLRSILQGFLLFKRLGRGDLIASVSNLILMVLFVLLLDRGLIGLVYARVISLSLACAFEYYCIPTKKQFEFHLDILKEALAFGFPLQINDILGFAFGRIDTLIIGALLGPADIAYYEIARKIPDSFAQLYEAFRAVYFPFVARLFARGEQKKAARVLNNSTRLISFASLLGTLVALLFGSDIISLLFSERYLPSVSAFVLLMIVMSISRVGNILGTSLVALGDSGKPAIINTAHTAVSLVSNLILIPAFGIVGAALASLAGTSAANPLNVLFLRRRKVDVRASDYLKPILVFGAFLLLALLLKPTTFLQKALVVLLFLFSCRFLSVITGDDLAALSREVKLVLFKLRRSVRSGGTKT